MKYIVAFDIGVASVGWAIIDKETETVVESAFNIFPEASAQNNQTRREMRQARRIKRRRKTRLADFNKTWQKYGFIIPKTRANDIVSLKVKALSEKVSLDELYMILYNYLKHRGISYLEDADSDLVQGSSEYAKGLELNAKALACKYPCEIQKERLEKIGKYRGQTQIQDEEGEKINLNNVFTISAYRKEIQQVFEKQKEYHPELSDAFCDEYLLIFNRKRKYYIGPGSQKSRTDYGIYTTKTDENGQYIDEKSGTLIERMIGKCSVYKDKQRAASATYTAQEFNLLNDLNNLTVNGRKLQEDEKRQIVTLVKNSKRIDMRKIISNAMGEKIEEFYGARVDKSEKEIFHKFESYNEMKKALADIEVDISVFSREELDEIGYILTINPDKEALMNAFNDSDLNLTQEMVDCLINLKKKNSSLFSKWHSFSLEIMNELIPEMYAQPKEQMTLLTEMGVFGKKTEEFAGIKYIPENIINEEIFNPIVCKSVRISIKILNEILKKYGMPDTVVIEMPRDRNSEEQKKRKKDFDKQREVEMEYIEKKLVTGYGIRLSSADYSKQKQLELKLKLWNEQDGKCLYSGKPIVPKDILEHPEMFEIDHIIPRSISYDDSRTNKVLVYSTENQGKGNQTSYYYMTHSYKAKWSFEQYKAEVLRLSKKKEYAIPRKKVQNLLFSDDITKRDVLKGFINRNINDTRYASRVVLNTVQSYFEAKQAGTKVKTVKGLYTSQMRNNMKLDKNRKESYTHHAVDAMLIGFSQLGYESYHKLQGSFIDFETGEILDKKMWEEKMSDDIYIDYIYGKKWIRIRQEIVRAEKEVKYWYYVDRKANRVLSNQTIRGTREYNGKIYKIYNFDIRSEKGYKLFKKLAFNEKERERLLVYKNDRRTFDCLVQIMKDYSDATNPFVEYEKETGDYVRKYAKKHNGPRIDKLKYRDGEVGSCIDISHKYGHEKGSKKVILESLEKFRMDVYYKEAEERYYLIGINQSDLKCENGKCVIDEDKYATILVNEKMIQHGQKRSDLKNHGFEFRLSFYKNDIIEYEKDGTIFRERFLSRTENRIETKPLDREKYAEKSDGRKQIRLKKTKKVVKYRMDILGNLYLCEKENFSIYC